MLDHAYDEGVHALQAAFLRPPLVGRAAYATLAFLNALGGPRFAGLQACLIMLMFLGVVERVCCVTKCCACDSSSTECELWGAAQYGHLQLLSVIHMRMQSCYYCNLSQRRTEAA